MSECKDNATLGVDLTALRVATAQEEARAKGDMRRHPLIGISSHPDYETGEKTQITQTYATAVTLAGGIPVALPCEPNSLDLIKPLLGRIDGLLLTGGGDIDPAAFGGQAYEEWSHADVAYVCRTRDDFEEALVKAAWEMDLPTLGICRGMQVMNVALGGRMVRDVSEQRGFVAELHLMEEPFTRPCHRVHIEEGSRLAQILGGCDLGVNSIHHQAISTPAPRGNVICHAVDGTPEGLEFPERTFFLGVQWHPEINGDNPQLFEAFVDAARQRMPQ